MKKQIISLSVRKIKIFLSTVIVAGILFATASCVDNTESESVSAIRNAKAAELHANADYLKAQAAVAQTLAAADAALTNAKAATEASVAKLNEAWAEKAKAEGEAEKLRAEAEKLIAEGAKAQSEALAEQYKAQAAQLEAQAARIKLEAETAAAQAAEELRVTKRNNDLLLATLEIDLQKAELTARNELLYAQKTYLANVRTLNEQVQMDVLYLIGKVNSLQNDVIGFTEDIAELNLDIKKNELALATYYIDSLNFVKRFEAKTKAAITKDSLSLKYREKELALLEAKSIPSLEGLTDALNEAKDQKEDYIKDTAKFSLALADLEATLPDLEADTVAKAEAKAEAKETFDAAQVAYDAVLEKYEDAYKNLTKYNEVASDISHVLGDNLSSGWVPGVNVLPKTIGSVVYTLELMKAKGVFDDSNTYTFDDKFNALVNLTIYADEYKWDYKLYEVKIDDLDLDSKYPTPEALVTDIELNKVDTIYKSDALAKARNTLILYSDSLQKYGDSISTDKNAEFKAKAEKVKAEKDLDDAKKVYDKALATLNAKPTPHVSADSVAVKTAAQVYMWKNWDLTINLPNWDGPLNTSKDTLNKIAGYKLDSIQKRLVKMSPKYDNYKSKAKDAIQAIIIANNEYNTSVKKLADLEALKDVLKLGTREKLVSAVNAALDALQGPAGTLSAANDSLQAATGRYKTAIYNYDEYSPSWFDAKDLYKKSINKYNELVLEIDMLEFKISLGGKQNDIDTKADDIASLTEEIAKLKADLAHNSLKLENLAKYAIDNETEDQDGYKLSLAVAEVVKYYEQLIAKDLKEIAKKEVEIVQAQKKADIYQTSIDILLKEYESLGE
jgi:hypothetical protein